jgi:hypothetical protein
VLRGRAAWLTAALDRACDGGADDLWHLFESGRHGRDRGRKLIEWRLSGGYEGPRNAFRKSMPQPLTPSISGPETGGPAMSAR